MKDAVPFAYNTICFYLWWI